LGLFPPGLWNSSISQNNPSIDGIFPAEIYRI
jgi:hypothetical protein